MGGPEAVRRAAEALAGQHARHGRPDGKVVGVGRTPTPKRKGDSILAVTLADSGDLERVLLYAAIAGLIGAFVGELVTTRGRSGDWGGLERPRWRDTKRWYDLGSFASIPIGVVAGCIAALTLAPETQVVTNGVTTETMETEAVLATGLIAGLAGAAFLRVLQDRFVALAKTQELRGVVQAAAETLAGDATPAVAVPDAVNKVKNADDDAAAAAVVTEITETAGQASAARVDGARQALLAAVSE